jgi:hypothetical protein
MVQSVREFAAEVIAEENLANSLARMVEGEGFLAAVTACAHARNAALSTDLVASVQRSDVIGMTRFVPPLFAGSALPPRHWLPVAVTAAPRGIAVDWAWFGPEPLRASFYEEEIRRALALPFNRAFRYRTNLDDLIAGAGGLDSREPDGFIFHMSRCGSTLVAQMLAALPDSIVISEAAPIDTVVQLGRCGDLDVATRALRAIITAFGRKRAGKERRYVVKLDAWHSLALPLFRRAFPDVPWVFLYRDPVEVLVSQMRQRGVQTVPQYFPPSFFSIADEDSMADEDYCAQVLAAICWAAVDHFGLGGGLMLDYRVLPAAVATAIVPHFGLACSAEEREAIFAVVSQDAKSPLTPFTVDTTAKQRAATAQVRRAADRHLAEVFHRLVELQRFGPYSQSSSPRLN